MNATAAIIILAACVCAIVAAYHEVERHDRRADDAEAALDAEVADHERTREALWRERHRPRLVWTRATVTSLDQHVAEALAVVEETPLHDEVAVARFRRQLDEGRTQ